MPNADKSGREIDKHPEDEMENGWLGMLGSSVGGEAMYALAFAAIICLLALVGLPFFLFKNLMGG